MNQDEILAIEKRLATTFLVMLIRFGLLVGLAIFCLEIISPFGSLMLWSVILAVTLQPLHQRLAQALHGKQGRASAILVLLGLLLIGLPTGWLFSTLGGSVGGLLDTVNSENLQLPPPPERVAQLPVVGEKLRDLWIQGVNDLPGLLKSYRPELAAAIKAVLAALASMSAEMLMLLASFIVAGLLMARSGSGARTAERIAHRLAGADRGTPLVTLCVATIRAVATGVLGVAFLQALLAGVVMALAGVPAAGILFLLCLILGIAQVPVILATAPAIAYLWLGGEHSTPVAALYTVLLFVAGMADNVLKPLLLGRGVDAPMPVVLLGAIGGMASAGLLGLFLGATVLSIGYQLFMAWVDEEKRALEIAPPQSPPEDEPQTEPPGP